MAIYGNIEEVIKQVPVNTRLMRGLNFLQEYLAGHVPEMDAAISTIKLGESAEVSLDHDGLRVMIQCYRTRCLEAVRFEAHKHLTDLQYICAGREWILLCRLPRRRSESAFDQNGNFYFPLENQCHTQLLMEQGDIAVLFPNDAHAPCVSVLPGGDQIVHKIVIKVHDALRCHSA